MVQRLQASERMHGTHAVQDGLSQKPLVGSALLLLAAIVVAAWGPLHGAAQAAVGLAEAMIRQHPGGGALAFLTLAALSAMLAFFSIVALIPVATHHWGQATTVALLWVGWLAGGAMAYAVGRFLGARVARVLVGTARIEYLEDRLTARAPFWMIVLLQLAVPSEIPGYVLGSLRYRFLAYFLALALAELPFAVGAVVLSSGFLDRRYGVMALVGAAGIGVLAWAIRRLRRELEAR
jgi:uncharacterized membrane protein YdjX (TVP38/TMEM64 family)